MSENLEVTEESPKRTLNQISGLITDYRDTGNGFHISARHYPSGEMEVSAIKLGAEDSLKKGGGAKRKNNKKSEMDEKTLDKSIHRTRTNVRRKTLALDSDRLLTTTFKDNLQDVDKAWSIYKYFIKLMRWRFKEFPYVVVMEYQKRGAIHFHLAIKGYYHANTVRRFWRRAAGQYGGNIDITDPRKAANKNSWNPKRIAHYIAKYITKEDSAAFNRRRYATGGRIQVPEPLTGWLALGVSVERIMRLIIESISGKQPNQYHECDSYFYIYYLSTMGNDEHDINYLNRVDRA